MLRSSESSSAMSWTLPVSSAGQGVVGGGVAVDWGGGGRCDGSGSVRGEGEEGERE